MRNRAQVYMERSNNHLVIMAGGVGSRFWPMSTVERPKQFIDILGTGRTMIQMVFDRFKGVVESQNMWVVTNKCYREQVLQQLPDIPESHILCEPCRRNTAPCIAYVSWRIKKESPKANIVVAPSDHLVVDTGEFKRVVSNCLEFTSGTDAIVTLGMKATRPETGYGYIQADLSLPSPRNREIYRVDQFHEKPKLEQAEVYLKEKNYFWNAGIFIWNVATIVNAFRVYQPNIAKVFDRIRPMLGTKDEQRIIDEIYPQCENISVDYAIMEKADEIFVCPSDFGWSDLGTWGSLLMQTPKDVYGNATIGQNIQLYESHNCIVHTLEEKRVVIEGLDGYIIAEDNDSLLICKLSEEQRIRQFSEKL